MNRITTILLTSAVVGILVLPSIVLGACGDTPLCPECLTEKTCEDKLLCTWDGVEEECVNQEIVSIAAGDITTALGHVGDLFASAKLLILLAVGLPLGFYVIVRTLRLVPADRGRRGK